MRGKGVWSTRQRHQISRSPRPSHPPEISLANTAALGALFHIYFPPSRTTFSAFKTLTLVAVVAMVCTAGDVVRGDESYCDKSKSQPAVAVKDIEPTKYMLAEFAAKVTVSAGRCMVLGSNSHGCPVLCVSAPLRVV
ncbi:hypothetical protein H310_08468 [Aphanomyces invadans]|uniref:Uncharacterized protein n=1 Tax=Aphanomyces invadans TaxID=157072 RepID=A0A024TZE0_9STRA|nr:hypothetical protein H310_08468 [Aphanomyces invadans]ETV98996.1 hypothetical protein H310_08468 [Aphanomyces invadans]|eukprot:XP_008872424.1 hypothetical protein H310_08468 [Aphanomyces invadans]